MPSPDTLFTATWIVPMNGPPIRDGGVLVRAGRVVAVDAAAKLARRWPNHTTVDFGRKTILPGLINAHTHLELSALRPPAPAIPFVEWIRDLGRQLRRGEPDFASRTAAAVTAGAAESLAFGVTCVGDISQQYAVTRLALHDGPLRVVSFGEALGLGGLRARFELLRRDALDLSHETRSLRCAISPHAPYTVDEAGLRACLADAEAARRPLCLHLAETPAEREFTKAHSGDFRNLWETLGLWDGSLVPPGVTPIELADRCGLLESRSLLAHVNDCDDDDLQRLRAGNASVVFCPRTHAYFDRPPHRWREMLAAGINVCLGTDSRASSPDLDVMADVRHVARTETVDPATLLGMITHRAASALHERDRGTLAKGRVADLAVFDTDASEPLNAVVREPVRCVATVCAGRIRQRLICGTTRSAASESSK